MITKEEIEALVKDELYFTTHHPSIFGEDGQITICVLKTHSGYEVTGQSGTITPRENWDMDKSKQLARDRAIQDLWGKEAYFRQRLQHIRKQSPNINLKSHGSEENA